MPAKLKHIHCVRCKRIKPHCTRLLCLNCYTYARNHGFLLDYPNPEKVTICKTEGCNKPIHAFQLCRSHYDTLKNPERRLKRRMYDQCEEEGCASRHYAGGFCKPHFHKWVMKQFEGEEDDAGTQCLPKSDNL